MAGGVDISRRPAAAEFVHFPQNFGRRFIVTVDTEEEFDWGAPLTRDNHGLRSIPAIARFQQFCEGFGVVPIYLVDYPIATAPATAEVLRSAIQDGRAEVGVQLHPWVSPPFEEAVSEFNSFSGNLPAELEREKFFRLRDAIESGLGAAPRIYRAGRYGIGPSSAEILRDAGIAIDTSVRTQFDYSHTGGPNFRDHPLRPYWLDRPAGLLELPLTTVFSGLLRRLGPRIYPSLWRDPRMRGALARAGMLERIALTPEGIRVKEAIRGIDAALDQDLPVLVFSFHSPSLEPGHTPYVRDAGGLEAFYDWWRQVFAHLAQRQVKPACVRDIMGALALA